MNSRARDIIKTVAAVLVIGGIVVATFLYGNRQRQEQIRRDQALKQEQEQQQAAQQPQQTPETPTVPVGGGTPPVAVTTPHTGASHLPDTGAEPLAAAATAGLVLLYRAQRQSRRMVRQAAITR